MPAIKMALSGDSVNQKGIYHRDHGEKNYFILTINLSVSSVVKRFLPPGSHGNAHGVAP
ncbi:MAG: hypothetical protein ACI8R9_000639 [Paraglaciecola sp.]|jgi:hypothetical protein